MTYNFHAVVQYSKVIGSDGNVEPQEVYVLTLLQYEDIPQQDGKDTLTLRPHFSVAYRERDLLLSDLLKLKWTQEQVVQASKDLFNTGTVHGRVQLDGEQALKILQWPVKLEPGSVEPSDDFKIKVAGFGKSVS